MTMNEFLEKFRANNDGPTGEALLDRILFKVLVVNRFSSAEALYDVYEKCFSGSDDESSSLHKEEVCPLPKNLDLHILKLQMKKIKVPKEVAKLALHLWTRLTQVLEQRQAEESQQCKEDPSSMPYPYTKGHAFSKRGAMKLVDIMKAGAVINSISTLSQPQQPLPTCLSPEDIKFSQLQMIMQGPGRLETGTPDSFDRASLCPSGKLLNDIRGQYAR
jgi:hypothetical protein